MGHSGHLCVMASEESEDIIPIPGEGKKGKYVLMFDPLDGSSNIDVNASIGTIFSIHRKVTTHTRRTAVSKIACKRAREQIAAGYFIYGSSTMMVYTTGHGVTDSLSIRALASFCFARKHPHSAAAARSTASMKATCIRGTREPGDTSIS